MKKMVTNSLVVLVVLGLASLTQADPYFEDFSDTGGGGVFELDNTGLPGTAPGGGSWASFFGGGYTSLNGKGGWVPGDYAGGEANEVILIDGWGANPDPLKSGVYAHSGWVSPYFVGGDNSNFNSLAHAIPGSLTTGDEISWVMNVSHSSSFMDVGIGTNLSDGAGNESWFHIEMGGAVNNRMYYRIFDSSGAGTVFNDTVDDPLNNGGHMGHWAEVVVTMGLNLETINIDARNLTRFDKPGFPGENIVGIGPWTNIVTGHSIGTIASSGLEIEFSGQGGSNDNWSQSATFDVISIVDGPEMLLINHATVSEDGPTNDTVTMRLTSAPPETIEIFGLFDPNIPVDATVSPTSYIVNPATMGSPPVDYIFTITAVDDSEVEETEVIGFKAVVDTNDVALEKFTQSNTVNVTILDNDGVQVSKSQLSVSEEGATSDDYTVVLGISPVSDPVTIDLTTDNSQITLDTAQIIFVTGNWNIPVTVTATAVDDPDGEDDPHSVDITHVISSSDVLYDSVASFDVAVSIADNDCSPSGPFLVSDISGPTPNVPDCVVDLYDAAKLFSEWLVCSTPNVPGCVTP